MIKRIWVQIPSVGCWVSFYSFTISNSQYWVLEQVPWWGRTLLHCNSCKKMLSCVAYSKKLYPDQRLLTLCVQSEKWRIQHGTTADIGFARQCWLLKFLATATSSNFFFLPRSLWLDLCWQQWNKREKSKYWPTLQTSRLSSRVGWWWMASGGETSIQMTLMRTWTNMSPVQMISWDLGEMKFGLLADLLDASKIRAMRLVLVRSAPYTMLWNKVLVSTFQ